MTLYQKALTLFYPIRMKFSNITGIGKTTVMNTTPHQPLTSFYSLTAIANDGHAVSFEAYKGKNILIVNLASNCGYTGQYADLEELYREKKDRLVVLGFPANDFGSQEPGDDNEIAAFCKKNYDVSFPLFQKARVKGNAMQPVYKWLTDPKQNGWNTQQPTWNFCKYLVDANGKLTHFFSPAVNPLSEEITDHLH